MISKEYTLDMTPGGMPVIVHMSQYDSDFQLIFHLYSRNGTLTIEDGTTAAIRGTKTDNHGYSVDATLSGQDVIVAGDQQMTAAAGRNVFELTLYKDGKELNTANFIIRVERAALDKDTPASGSVLRELIDILDQTNEIIVAGQQAEEASAKMDALSGQLNQAVTATGTLETTIENAGTAKTALDGSITAAGTTKTSLDASNTAAQATLESLEAEDATAVENIAALSAINFDPVAMTENVSDLRAYLGLYDNRVLGVQVDYENKTYTRLAGAKNLNAGADFDAYSMFGGRRRCNLADDGTINAYYGDAGFVEDGSNGQVMVYQPAFYYLVYPVKLEPQETGIGYHLRKANYYVSAEKLPGFKLHPAFYDENGNAVDHIFYSAYEGSLYDASASAYVMDDAQVMTVAEDKFCSIAGAKPASGKTQDLTRPKIHQMCTNRGVGWYSDNIKATSANQMLMIVEMGMMNMQTAIGQGVVNIADDPNTENNSKVTGETSALGNGTGQATGTSGQVSVSYRGYENPWGNIWKFIYGVNIWGDGTLGGGVPYYATDFNFEESKRTDNYVSAGFSCANAGGYISAIGYAPECDWMFIGSEVLGNSSVPVGDYQRTTENLNDYKIARLGGSWGIGSDAGAFSWYLYNGVGYRYRYIGGRLVYVPTATA